MDENESTPQVYIAPVPWYRKKLLLAGVLLLVISPLIATGIMWLTDQPLFQPQKQVSQSSTPSVNLTGKTLSESSSPIALDILKNPLVYEWWGSVEGTLVAKDNQSITLEKDGKRITIALDLTANATGTTFFLQSSTKLGPKAKDIKIEEIPLGSHLRGDFLIHQKDRNKIIGSSFIVLEK